jgi:hypothetical protein
MSRVTHWRFYFPCAIGENGAFYVDVEDSAAEQFRKEMRDPKPGQTLTIVTGREPNIRTSRTLYVNPAQIVALEPIEG